MLSYEWHQPDLRNGQGGFDEAEFYEHGPVVTVSHDGRSITVDREGSSRLVLVNETQDSVEVTHIQEATAFRQEFPRGVLPDLSDSDNAERFDLEANGWFDLYDADVEQGEMGHLDRLDYSLTAAIGDAEDLLIGDA